jgi:hypothetical protein
VTGCMRVWRMRTGISITLKPGTSVRFSPLAAENGKIFRRTATKVLRMGVTLYPPTIWSAVGVPTEPSGLLGRILVRISGTLYSDERT